MAKYEMPSADDRRIWDLWVSGTFQGAIAGADDAAIFDSLHEAPATITELAARLDYDERATGILLRFLASMGLLIVRRERFRLSDEARLYLVKTSPFYWGNMMRVGASQWHVDTLLAKLRLKGSAEAATDEGTPRISGDGRSADSWAAGQVSLDDARLIAARMHSHSLAPAICAARNYDFQGVHRILDVGGGSGCFMVAMAQAHPHLRCTIMELPAMCAVATTYIQAGEVPDRVDTVAVDMFRQPWPRGYDALFFSNVWHDWNFRTCRWLAGRAFDALPSGGRIMLHEMLLDDGGAGPSTAAGFSMMMLLATQGQQFTFGELQGILEAAGFTRIEARHTGGYYSIVTGYKT